MRISQNRKQTESQVKVELKRHSKESCDIPANTEPENLKKSQLQIYGSISYRLDFVTPSTNSLLLLECTFFIAQGR